MDLLIFLSSTSEDLRDAREQISNLLSVIPAEVVRMEIFGSDETRPLDYSLRQVRHCNLFVGVYAERYGTVDPDSGRSITELEYREARRMVATGDLPGLLVYILDPQAYWPLAFVDREPEKVERLLALKEEIKQQHTVTFFGDIKDLARCVLRDVLRKIGVGVGSAFAARPPVGVAESEAVPFGMEHYTERDARYLHGREQDIAELSRLLADHPLVLLIGDSGVGKTSLVQAGLFPALKSDGWAVASCRPLDRPDAVIPQALWDQLMKGRFPADTPLSNALGIAAAAHGGRRVLAVIDQLEDAIPYLGSPRTEELLSALGQIHTSPPANVRVLLCYRGDADPKIGKYWQIISGSATGLPRHYLEPLGRNAAETALWEILGPHVTGTNRDSGTALVRDITDDLEAESSPTYAQGIYPPFLQMVAEGLLRAGHDRGVALSREFYRSLGGSRELIGRYLLNQLRFVHGYRDEARRILQSLAGRTRRLQKSVDDLTHDTGIGREVVESCLEQLTSLRLVRATGDVWEIVHDFLAERVLRDLADPEELEARTFRELLMAKAAAFDRTGELLSASEHVGLYIHRRRVSCPPEEVRLLFASGLAGNGPVSYYVRQLPPDRPLDWASDYCSHDDERTRRNAYRFLLRRGRDLSLDTAIDVFGDHKLQFELAPLVTRFATSRPDDITALLRLRKKRAEVVAHASRATLEAHLTEGDRHSDVLDRLLRSNDHADLVMLGRVFSAAARPSQVAQYRSEASGKRRLTRVRAICALGSVGSQDDVRSLTGRMRSARKTEARFCGYAMALWCCRNSGASRLTRMLRARRRDVVAGALAAIGPGRAGMPMGELLALFRRFPDEVSRAVVRCVEPGDRPHLRQFLKQLRLDPPVRDLIMALVKVGDASDVRFALELIASHPERAEFWTIPLLANTLATHSDRSLLSWLMPMADSKEFWEYVGADRASPPLPVANHENLYIFKRLAGACLASICGPGEWLLLKRLLFHEYWDVQVAAGRAILRFAGERELDDLLGELRGQTTRVSRATWALDSGIMQAICALDEKVYPPTENSP